MPKSNARPRNLLSVRGILLKELDMNSTICRSVLFSLFCAAALALAARFRSARSSSLCRTVTSGPDPSLRGDWRQK
jgi:hypothetical protein